MFPNTLTQLALFCGKGFFFYLRSKYNYSLPRKRAPITHIIDSISWIATLETQFGSFKISFLNYSNMILFFKARVTPTGFTTVSRKTKNILARILIEMDLVFIVITIALLLTQYYRNFNKCIYEFITTYKYIFVYEH